MFMRSAQIVTKIDAETTRCNACQWRCVLKSDEAGRCLVRVGSSQGIDVQNTNFISAAEVGAIEDHRLWHFFPDTMVLSIGSWGYAFPADQQRGDYARPPEDPAARRELAPERVAAFALKRLCRGVVWTYSEPAVAQEYAHEVLQSSRAASRYTALTTTAFLTEEALDSFGPYLDGISVDLRGFGDAAYARLADITNWRSILDIVARAYHRWECHIELTTRLHRGVNDDPDELRALVGWVRENLGAHIPWHVLPGDRGAETAASVGRARRIGHENGLQFVYGPEPNQPTLCPQCQALLMTREQGVIRMVGLFDGSCSACGFKPYLRTSIFKR